MAIDALGSQNFHLSLDVTGGIHANVAAPVPVAETLDSSDALPIDSAEPAESEVDAAAADVTSTPASYWSLPYVVADALAASTAEAAPAIPPADAAEIAPAEHAGQHADQTAIALADDTSTDVVTADDLHGAALDETVSDVTTVPEDLHQESAVETSADAGSLALATIAIHQYQTMASLAALISSH